MISRSGSMVAEQDTAVGADDKDPRELAHITLRNAHTVPLGHGRAPPEYHFGREQLRRTIKCLWQFFEGRSGEEISLEQLDSL